MADITRELGLVKGDDGVGIASFEKTSTTGLVDTYTITLTNGDKKTINVTNGADGDPGKNALINGINSISIREGANITLTQEGDVLTISSSGGSGGSEESKYIISSTLIDINGRSKSVTADAYQIAVNETVFKSSQGNVIIAPAGFIDYDSSINFEKELFYREGQWVLDNPEIISSIAPIIKAPVITSNGTWGISELSCRASRQMPNSGSITHDPFKALNDKGKTDTGNFYASGGGDLPLTYDFAFSESKILKSVVLYNRPTDTTKLSIRTGAFQASNDDINWVNLKNIYNADVSKSGTYVIDLSKNNTPYKYYRLYATSIGYNQSNFVLASMDIYTMNNNYSGIWVDNSDLSPKIKKIIDDSYQEYDATPPVAKITVKSGVVTVENYEPNQSLKYTSMGNINFLSGDLSVKLEEAYTALNILGVSI